MIARLALQALGDELSQLVPPRAALQPAEPREVGAGVIFAWGERDIDDPVSGLHERAAIGPEFRDGYVTVNTGKLTTAPLFADEVARRLAAELGG